jgi:hypothetical protein
MRIESTVAQQSLLATAGRGTRTSRADRTPQRADDLMPFRPAGAGLPSPVADRLALLLASDPALAEAVSAHMPAARQASARDLAAYGQALHPRTTPRFVDVNG